MSCRMFRILPSYQVTLALSRGHGVVSDQVMRYTVLKSLTRAAGPSWEAGDELELSEADAAKYAARLLPIAPPPPARGKGKDAE